MTGRHSPRVDAVFFDLFGTLLRLEPLDEACEVLAVGRGAEIAARWRARQLEVSWLRTLVGNWADFDVVTADALASTLTELDIAGDADAVNSVAGRFATLPAREEAQRTLDSLRRGGLSVGILTNASVATLRAVGERTGLPVDHTLSVDAVRAFKPHPSVYELAVRATGFPAERIGFVTGNGWDAAGASAFGFRVAWLRTDASAVVPAVGAPEPMIASWDEVVDLFVG